jgi:hypothetical protein
LIESPARVRNPSAAVDVLAVVVVSFDEREEARIDVPTLKTDRK